MSFRALAACLPVVALLLASGGVDQETSETRTEACQQDVDTFWDDPRWEADDWSPLLPDAHALVLAYDAVNVCGARIRHIENLLFDYTGRYVSLDSAQAVYFETGYFDASPALAKTKALRMRGRNEERLGRIGSAAHYMYRAATYADSVRATHAAKVNLEAAISAQRVGRHDLALRYLDRAFAALPDSLRASDSDEGRFARSLSASVLFQRALAYEDAADDAADPNRRRDRLRRAADVNERAAEAFASANWEYDGEEWAHVLGQRARLLVQLGSPDAAADAVRRAHERLATEEGEVPTSEIELAILDGDVQAALGNAQRARERFAEAQEIAVSAGLPSGEGDALVALGRLEERLGRLTFAERAYRAASAIRELDRERAGLREWTASAFARRQEAHRGLARVLLASGDVRGSLAALDATRARAYHDLRRYRQRHRAIGGDARRRVDALTDSLESVRRRIGQRPDDDLRLETDVVAYQDSLSTALGIEPLPVTPLDIPRVQTHLAEASRDVVSYVLSDSVSTAYIVTADTVAAVTLPAGRREITRAARALLAPWLSEAPDPAADLDAAHSLYRLVFAPVEPMLTPDAALTVVPDGVLAHVPFGMLTRAPSESYAAAPYLMRERAITMELAVGLVGAPHGRGADGGTVVFGRSDFDGPPSDTRGLALGALPHVADEVEQIGRHAGGSTVALNDEATESALVALAPAADVVHVATHAVTDPELPMNSHVVLSTSPETGDDGRLHLYEMQNRDLDADLVVLSGCATADGELQAGEGLMGMGYGVRVAGAAASIATLWAVDDRATVFLMDALYASLADGMPKDDALRQAQLTYLDAHDGLAASPFYWAAPVLSGAPGPVSLGGRSWPWAWIWLAGAAGALAWWLTRRPRPWPPPTALSSRS